MATQHPLNLCRPQERIHQATTDDGATPLIIAAYLGRSEVVQVLLSANADRACRSPGDGRTAAEWCEQGARAPHWGFVEGVVDEQGRAECRALFESPLDPGGGPGPDLPLPKG